MSRSSALDAVRILGIVAIVGGHTWALDSVARWLYPWHVAVFFVLSGYLWSPGRSLGELARRRARSLLVPYAVWLVLGGVVYLAARFRHGTFEVGFLRDAIFGGAYLSRPFSAFWFFPALFLAALMYWAVSRLPALAQGAVAVAVLALVALLPGPLVALPFSIGQSLVGVVLMMAGRLAAAWPRQRWRGARPWGGAIGAAAVVGGLALTVSGVVPWIDIRSLDLGIPVVSLAVGAAISVGLILVAESVLTRPIGAISALATTGTAVILGHAFILWPLYTPDTGSLRDFVLALTVPWIVGFVAWWTPLAPYVLGVPRRTRASAPPREPERSLARAS